MELLITKNAAENIQNILKEKHNKKLTIFAIYKILRELKKEGVIIKTEKDFSISEEWKTKILEGIKNTNDNIFNIKNNEKIEFKFTSLPGLDQQWKNIMISIRSKNSRCPIFFQLEHMFWTMLDEQRSKSEIEYIKSFNNEKTFAFYSLGGKTEYEKLFKKDFTNEFVKININEYLINKNNKQLTIYEEYIIYTIIPKIEADKIKKIFNSASSINELEDKIKTLQIEKRNIKLIIERNKKKAKILRKKLSKNFYIPKELIGKYDLF